MAAEADFSVRCVRRLALAPGERLRAAVPFRDGRTLLLFAEGEGGRAEVCDPDGARRVLLRRSKRDLSLGLCDEESARLVITIDNVPELFDLNTLAHVGSLVGHEPVIWELRCVSGGRLVSSSSDRQRILWDLSTAQAIVRSDLAIFQSWSAPRGLLPGDPLLVTHSELREGQWRSALMNAHTGEVVLEAQLPASRPAHHTVAASPDALEWAGVISEGAEDVWGPSQVIHFTAAGPRLLYTETVADSIPGVVSLRFLTRDWLYCSGARQPPLMINVRTGQRRASPQEGPVTRNNLMLCHREVAVLDLDCGELRPLHSAPPVEGRRLEALMITEAGDQALVATDTALEWWRIQR